MSNFVSTALPAVLFILIIAGGWWLARAWSLDFDQDLPNGP
jgi:hypothetical protein